MLASYPCVPRVLPGSLLLVLLWRRHWSRVERVDGVVHDRTVLAVVDHLVGLGVLVKVDDGVLAGDEVAVSVGGEVELVAGPDADGEGAEAHQAGQAAGV